MEIHIGGNIFEDSPNFKFLQMKKNVFYLFIFFVFITSCKSGSPIDSTSVVSVKCQLLAGDGFRYEYQNNLPITINGYTLKYTEKRIDKISKGKII